MSESSTRTFTGAQQLLRFVGALYLGWYVLSIALAIAFAAIYFVTRFDINAAMGAAESTPATAIANVIVFALDCIANILVAVAARHCANHPRFSRRFRIIAGVLLGLSALGLVYSIATGQFAGLASSFYSLVIVGFLFVLANQIVADEKAGSAPDITELPRTVTGRIIKTERQLERARLRGQLASQDTDKRGTANE